MNVNGQGRVKIKTRKKFLAAGKAWMAIFWPTPGFKGRNICQICVLDRRDPISASALRVSVCNVQLFKAEQESKARLGVRSRCGLICRLAGPSLHVQHTSYTSSKRGLGHGLSLSPRQIWVRSSLAIRLSIIPQSLPTIVRQTTTDRSLGAGELSLRLASPRCN